MPIFDFRCQHCRRVVEILVIGSREPACPACGSVKLVKLPSRFGLSSSGSPEGGSPGASSCGSCHAASCSSCRH